MHAHSLYCHVISYVFVIMINLNSASALCISASVCRCTFRYPRMTG